MARGHKDSDSNVAYCADYDSQAEEEVQESRKLASNGVKRSSQADMIAAQQQQQQQSQQKQQQADLASDSGYSSRTQTTAASADSVASIKAKAVAKMNNNVAEPGPSSRRRTTTDKGSHEQQQTQPSSKAPQRAASTAKKTKVVQCEDPNCTDKRCLGRGRKPRLSVSTTQSPTKSPEKSPAKAPSSTSRGSRTAEYTAKQKSIPISAEPQSRPRPPSSNARSRPTSMYEIPSHMMASPAGPPPAMYNRGAYPFTGHSPSYMHPPALAIVERPGLATRRTDMSARTTRPVSIYGNYANTGNPMSARQVPKPASPATGGNLEEEYSSEDGEEEEEEEEEEEDSESEYSESEEEDEVAAKVNNMDDIKRRLVMQANNKNLDDTQRKIAAARILQMERTQQQRNKMGPPAVAASAAAATAAAGKPNEPKLSMRKANGPAQISYGRRPSENNDQDLRALLQGIQQGAGAGNPVRPSLVSHGGSKAQTYSHPAGGVTVEPSGYNRRRMSYIGSENRADLEAVHARFQQSDDSRRNPPDFNQIVEKVVREKLAELHLPASSQPASAKMDLDAQIKAILAYQNRADQNATQTRDELRELPTGIPLTAAALRRKAGGLSQTGSSRSKRSSEDGTSRVSAGHRITTGSEVGGVTVNGDEMKFRINPTNLFEMEFEGRQVVIQPTGDGSTVELIIGGKRESSYYSAQGSNATRSQAGSRLTRTTSHSKREPSQRDRIREERGERDRDRDRDRDRAQDGRERARRYEDDEDDRRSIRGGARRRAETYDSEYSRSGKTRRQNSRDNRPDDYPRSSTYNRPQQYTGPGIPGVYILPQGFPPQAYTPGYASGNQSDHVFGA